ncbi:MAG: iron-containing alcohol dehydrogenase [Sandaracinaceae bacterium]
MSDPDTKRGLETLPGILTALEATRLLVICPASRRFLDRLDFGDRPVEVFDGATAHVPERCVRAAEVALNASRADTVVSLGGGSATGLAKALRLRHDVRFVAIPTTYAGSEQTRIWGITDGDTKQTGRDDRVRPDAILHAPELFAAMPRTLSVLSLLNAMAHPISALSTGELDAETEALALSTVEVLSWAIGDVLEAPTSPLARADALRGAALAGQVIDRAPLGAHHRVAHALGGALGLPHAALHALLLPHFTRRLMDAAPDAFRAISDAAGQTDLPGFFYDALTRVGAARSLLDLGVDPAAFHDLREDHEPLRAGWVNDALIGRRPSVEQRRWSLEGHPDCSVWGPELGDAARVVVAIHGRGANAGRMLNEVLDWTGHDLETAVVAPQAPLDRWYDESYRAPLADQEGALDRSLAHLGHVLDAVLEHVSEERVFLAGFSQGACLAAELFARRPERFGGLVALAGARIGPAAEQPAIEGPRTGTVLLGASRSDPWLDLADIHDAAEAFRAAGADVLVVEAPGDHHEVTARQRALAYERLVGRRDAPSGFGNGHAVEALPGALPSRQNTPLAPPYGLHPELVNGTGFTAARHDNHRVWLYRIRPSAQHSPLAPLAHDTLVADWDTLPPEPNLYGHRPPPPPDMPTDFVDGLATYAGAGHPSIRRGYAVHLYAANRSMEHRAFYNADGDLLFIPHEGALTLLTEQGTLEVGPGQIAVLPRGLKVSVLLHGSFARGWVGEVYGRHFHLPERGPAGSNGLTDARHFHAPRPFFEDRVVPGYRVTAKLGNALFEATQDHSPYDVVAWHGEYTPYVYDLADFSPIGNTRFDHPDPSMHVVIGAPLDEPGQSALDFVFFPPRWDPAEHTFRPPFFHRNPVTEFNGIISDPSLRPGGVFEEGMSFVTPQLTAHGVRNRGVHRGYQDAGEPARVPDGSAWFQLEAALPMSPTRWARDASTRIHHWPGVWGSYRPRFRPRRRASDDEASGR